MSCSVFPEFLFSCLFSLFLFFSRYVLVTTWALKKKNQHKHEKTIPFRLSLADLPRVKPFPSLPFCLAFSFPILHHTINS